MGLVIISIDGVPLAKLLTSASAKIWYGILTKLLPKSNVKIERAL